MRTRDKERKTEGMMGNFEQAYIQLHGKCPKCGEQGEHIGNNRFTCANCGENWGRKMENTPTKGPEREESCK